MKRKKRPLAKLYQPGFVYTPAVATNIRATFDRIRKEREAAKDEQERKLVRIIRKRA